MNNVKLLKGLASNSASPTDTWIVSSNAHTGAVFLKWFMYEHKTPLIRGMMYETRVYLDVTNPLIRHRVCPHFVKCIAGEDDKTLKRVMGVIKNSDVPRDDMEIVLKRSLYYQRHHLPARPSITNTNMTAGQRVFFKNQKFHNKVRMGYTATEAIDGKTTITLDDFVKGLQGMQAHGVPKYSQMLLHILFQLAVSSYAMHLSKMMHNDLHIGNVWVTNQARERFTYAINGDIYSFKTRIFTMLYDFDRSYVQRLGPNPFIESNPYLCEEASSCNSLQMGLDLLKVHCYLRRMLHNTPFQHIIDSSLGFLLKKKEDLRHITEYLDTPGCFLNKDTMGVVTRMPPRLYELLETAPMYMKKLSREITGLQRTTRSSRNVYICSEEMFDSNGVVHPSRRPALNYRVDPPAEHSAGELDPQTLMTFSGFDMDVEQ